MNTSEENPRLREMWGLLQVLLGRVGAFVVVAVSVVFLAASGEVVEVEPTWLAPLLEVAVTPVALVLSLTFGTAVLLFTRAEPIKLKSGHMRNSWL